MKAIVLSVVAGLGLAACAPQETVSKYGGADYLWHLSEIDGEAVKYAAEMSFDDNGSVRGEGPCNAFIAKQDKPYPWVEITVDVVEQVYCPDIDREEAFLTALQEMSLVEVSGPNMVMSNDDGRSMVFTGVTPAL